MVALRKWIRLVRGHDVKPLSLWILGRVFIHPVDGSRKVVGFGDTTCPGFVDLLLLSLVPLAGNHKGRIYVKCCFSWKRAQPRVK